MHEGRLVIIDLPQIVDVVANPQGPSSSPATSRNVATWFTGKGFEVDPEPLIVELLHDAGMRV